MPRLPGRGSTLAEVLARGGVGWVVGQIRLALDPTEIVGRIIGRFPLLAVADATFLERLAREAFQAGREFQRLGHIGVANVPVNRYLFGDRPEGRRFEYAAVVELDPRGQQVPEWFQTEIQSATELTFDQVASQAYVAAVDRFREKYPNMVADPILIGASMSYVQRRY